MLDKLFLNARTHHQWQDRPVPAEMLEELYNVMRWGPTASNTCPLRILFLTSKEAKARLVPALMGSNVGQVEQAPVTALLAMDLEFYTKLDVLMPSSKAAEGFRANPEAARTVAFRNSSLQGAYLILAARALGLDCGPMSGFDNAKVDAEFFEGTSWRSNFLCNLGYGDPAGLYPRGPRLPFAEACRIL